MVNTGNRANYTWVLKVIHACLCDALPGLVIGLRNSRHSHSIRSKPKPIVTGSHTFLRIVLATVFALSFDWFIELPLSSVIGQSDHFGFGFTTLNLINLDYSMQDDWLNLFLSCTGFHGKNTGGVSHIKRDGDVHLKI